MILIYPARTNSHCALSHHALRSTNTQTTGVRQMKLVELLAKELKEWPEEATMAVQDADGQIKMAAGYEPRNGNGQYGTWIRDEEIYHAIECYTHKLATDHATAIVTRADWEAEKARIDGKVDSGWKRHRGRKIPVSEGTKVDVKHRDGCIYHGLTAGEGMAANWGHSKHPEDIMAFRIHPPAAQPAPVSEASEQAEAEKVMQDCVEKCASTEPGELLYDPVAQGPLQWRDRIYELDTRRAELEATYQRQIGEIAKERGELVGKLASEGLALVEVVQPVEDMSDWRNWKAGDLLSYAKDSSGFYVNGDRYAIQSIKGESLVIDDKTGDKDHAWDAVVVQSYFKWHSRPGK